MNLSQPTNVSMLVISPVILGFGAAMILVTDSTHFGIFNLSVFFVSYTIWTSCHCTISFFSVLMHLASSVDEIREWRKTGQFELFAWHKLINESEKGREGKHSLQTKNTGNLPVHSQNVRVYGEVTGISRVYRWVTGFFLYYLSCNFVYHAKF